MDKLLERSFAGERYEEEENAPNISGSIEELNPSLLRRPESVRKTGSAALNEILRLHGLLKGHEPQSEASPTEDVIHDAN